MDHNIVAALEQGAAETGLSPKVHHLLCVAGVSDAVTPEAQACLDSEALLCWDRIHKLLPVAEESPEYFIACTTKLAPVFRAIDLRYQGLGTAEFIEVYHKYLKWTSASSVVQRCFEVACSGKVTGPVHALLLCTSVLERSLGDVYLLKGSQCPSMLKDLLVTTELTQLFGHTAVQLLRVLIGPPISLNLRNVLWHGFPSPEDIHPQYVYTVLCVIASLGKKLQVSGIRSGDIIHRDFVTFRQIVDLKGSLLEFSPSCLVEMHGLFDNSVLVVPPMRPFWHLALDQFEIGRYGDCVCVLLPQLEHALRRVFAVANHCPHRIVTAENTTFFTTFDEILGKSVDGAKENQLRFALGDSYMTMLLDMLTYPVGPRVRDRVSHGETGIDEVDHELAAHLICVCSALALLSSGDHVDRIKKSSLLQTLHEQASNYESFFHPLSLVKHELVRAGCSVSGWTSWPRPTSDQVEVSVSWEDDVSFPGWDQITGVAQEQVDSGIANLSILRISTDITAAIKDHLSTRISTLYRNQSLVGESNVAAVPSREEQVVGLLGRCVDEVLQTSRQTREAAHARYAQWQSKELRSRRRKTYARMLDSLPTLCASLRLVLLMTLTQLYDLDGINQRAMDQQQTVVRKWKMLLKYCENLHSYTNTDKNKWEEVVTLTKDIMSKVKVIGS